MEEEIDDRAALTNLEEPALRTENWYR